MRIRLHCSAVVLLACLTAAGLLEAQGLDYVKSHYTKYEYMIPMRDGVRLFTAVYAPKDTSQAFPLLMLRTPYSVGPYGSDNYRKDLGPSEKFGKEGYIFVYQDVRGCHRSEGEFVNVRPYVPAKRGAKDVDESSDTYDTIDWLVKNVPNNNGRVGVYGISYPGFYAVMASLDAHPALKAASPQAPIADWFVGDDFHHNGAFFLVHAFNFFAGFGRERPEPGTVPGAAFDHGTPDGYKFFLGMGALANADEKHLKGKIAFWRELMAHGSYDDYWKARNVRPHLKNIKPAMLTVGGWYDAEDVFGPLAVFGAIEKQSPGAINTLVEGPWSHGGWSGGDGDKLGDVPFQSKTAEFFRDNIQFPFFEYHLKAKGDAKIPKAYVFETGRNQWRKYDAWPPKGAAFRPLYLRAGGRLSFEAPPEETEKAYDEYISDPAKPVPFISGTFINMVYEYMTADQRFASSRTDVLTYEGEELGEDLTIAGPVTASLDVSTTGTDSDWVVKLIDRYPDDFPDNNPHPPGVRMGGYQQLLRGEPFRGKFRHGFDKPEPFEPGKVTKVEFVMPDVCHTFRRGHRIMVQVQSSWFPLADRNPQQFVDVYNARESDFRSATQRVYRSKPHPSTIGLSVLK